MIWLVSVKLNSLFQKIDSKICSSQLAGLQGQYIYEDCGEKAVTLQKACPKVFNGLSHLFNFRKRSFNMHRFLLCNL